MNICFESLINIQAAMGVTQEQDYEEHLAAAAPTECTKYDCWSGKAHRDGDKHIFPFLPTQMLLPANNDYSPCKKTLPPILILAV